MKVNQTRLTGPLIASAGVVLAGLVLTACGNSEVQSRSMEQIHAEEGVPVTVEILAPQAYSDEMTFTAVLTGIPQSSEYALISDRVESINVKVGDYVTKDSVILTFPSDNPAANYYQARVQYENAQATYRRMASYFEAGGISRQALDDARAGFEVAEANWNALRRAVQVKAPISGVVTALYVQPSDNVEKEDELFTISRTDRLKAEIWIPEREISRFKPGQRARAVWQGRELQGRVRQVDQALNRSRQAFGAVVEFDNPNLIMQYGVTAQVTVATYASEGAIVTERRSIATDRTGYYAYVARGGEAERRAVVLGNSSELSVEITEGLKPGDTLITSGLDRLGHGVKVRIVAGLSPQQPAVAASDDAQAR
jgi:RND family efflux transporter MFP subunit